MTFGTAHQMNRISYLEMSYQGHALENLELYKYLGVIQIQILTFSKHVAYMRTKVIRRQNVVKNKPAKYIRNITDPVQSINQPSH